MSKQILPCILGMNPPTKEIIIAKTDKPLDGYSLIINHATFPEGTVRGYRKLMDADKVERKGTAVWIHFCDADTMRRLGQDLVDFANRQEGEE